MTEMIDVDIAQDPAAVEGTNVPVTQRNRITATAAPGAQDIAFDDPCHYFGADDDPC